MADDELVQNEEKKGGMMKWIIIAVVIAALGVGGYFGYTMFFVTPDDGAETNEMAEGKTDDSQESLEGPIVPLPLFLVNLADPLGRRYLKLGIEVEVKDAEAQEALAKYDAKVKDKLLLLLSSKTYEGLSSTKAKIELKQEIASRLNQILGKGTVLRVYITEMVIQ